MDKITSYQEIISDILKRYGAIKKTLMPDVKAQVIIDKENNHYQLLSVGWHRNRFVHSTAFHFDIVNGKIWLQQNNTDVDITEELMERGVPREDIVLGFIPENVRAYTNFAVA